MAWSSQQMEQFRSQGYLFCPGLFSDEEIGPLTAEVPRLLAGQESDDGMHREYERTGAVRQVYLAHRHSPAFRALSRDPKIAGPVKQLLQSDAYIYHSKLNVKEAFEGTVWLWHQDYGYWIRDGVQPRLISVMLFLDQATLNNGCLMVAGGSHRLGVLPHFDDTETTSYRQWCIEKDALQQHLAEEAIRPLPGNPGDVLFFDCNLMHGSGHNMSPLPRKTFIIVYNDINNQPDPVPNPRPDWVVARNFEVVT